MVGNFVSLRIPCLDCVMSWILHLGREADLARAELDAIFPYNYINLSPELALIEAKISESEILPWQNKLASIIKISQLIDSIGHLKSWDTAQVAGMNYLRQAWPVEHISRRDFGFSYLGSGDTIKWRRAMDVFGLQAKKMLKALNEQPVRYVREQEAILSSVVIKKEKLIPPGVEINFIHDGESWLLSRTVSVQDWEAWQWLDLNRPSRDKKSGILPVKLATLMVNLAGKAGTNDILWDPFCGSGTILMAAATAGYQQIIGSDISPEAVAGSQEALIWHSEHFPSTRPSKSNFQVGSANKLKIQATKIVTEPYMGKPWLSLPSKHEAEMTKRELINLYRGAAAHLAECLPLGGRLVTALPAWRTNESDSLEPSVFCDYKDIFDSRIWKLAGPENLFHALPKHVVVRQIVSLEKKV